MCNFSKCQDLKGNPVFIVIQKISAVWADRVSFPDGAQPVNCTAIRIDGVTLFIQNSLADVEEFINRVSDK